MARVEARPLLPMIEELVAAVGGNRQAAERIGITDMGLRYIRRRRTKMLRQSTAQAILLAAWPYSSRARTRSAHGLFDSRACSFGTCAEEATHGDRCRWHLDSS